jgi:hypothetical protein
MRVPDRRKYPRLSQSFPVQLLKNGVDLLLEGTSVDVSQGGAFIQTKNWRSFKVREQATIAFFLPPQYTGQDEVVGLQGEAVIARVDQENKGIGVKFIRNFKQFTPISLPDAVGQS